MKRKETNRSNPTGKIVGCNKILNTLVVAYGDRVPNAVI